jgi:hypothetical protein
MNNILNYFYVLISGAIFGSGINISLFFLNSDTLTISEIIGFISLIFAIFTISLTFYENTLSNDEIMTRLINIENNLGVQINFNNGRTLMHSISIILILIVIIIGFLVFVIHFPSTGQYSSSDFTSDDTSLNSTIQNIDNDVGNDDSINISNNINYLIYYMNFINLHNISSKLSSNF